MRMRLDQNKLMPVVLIISYMHASLHEARPFFCAQQKLKNVARRGCWLQVVKMQTVSFFKFTVVCTKQLTVTDFVLTVTQFFFN